MAEKFQNFTDHSSSKRSVWSDEVHVSLSPSTFEKLSRSKPRTAKYKKTMKSCKKESQDFPPIVHVPTDAAAHFGNFYNAKDFGKSKTKSSSENEFSQCDSGRTEFTRQMLYKLEHSAGTQNYAKQVSAFLEETVEPACFKVKLPPAENCIPNEKLTPYPLWYKEPDKMPFESSQQYRSVKKKYEGLAQRIPNYKNELEVRKIHENYSDSNIEDSENDSQSTEEEYSSEAYESSTVSDKSKSCSTSTESLKGSIINSHKNYEYLKKLPIAL